MDEPNRIGSKSHGPGVGAAVDVDKLVRNLSKTSLPKMDLWKRKSITSMKTYNHGVNQNLAYKIYTKRHPVLSPLVNRPIKIFKQESAAHPYHYPKENASYGDRMHMPVSLFQDTYPNYFIGS